VTLVDAATAEELVHFLGLEGVADPAAGRTLSFPLGVLYPYSADLRRVYDQYLAVAVAFPDSAPLLVGQLPSDGSQLLDAAGLAAALDGYLLSIEQLHARTAFAPGPIGAAVERAYGEVADAISRTKRKQRTSRGAGR
jgi:hypothetical protein